MSTYHITVDAVVLEAESEDEARQMYIEKVEDPFFCIDVLSNYEINESKN